MVESFLRLFSISYNAACRSFGGLVPVRPTKRTRRPLGAQLEFLRHTDRNK